MQIQSRIRNWIGANDREIIASLDGIDEFLRVLPAPWPERFQQAQRLGTAKPDEMAGGRPGFPFNSKFVFDSMISPNAEFEARCQAALTSLAIEQFRLRHAGQLPESLADLVPGILREAPRDPFDGQPMRYKRWLNGYCIYSVGKNGRDDGGVESGSTQARSPQVVGDDIAFCSER